MLLILMRTVEAELPCPDTRDSERAITDSGRGDAIHAAAFMKALGLEPRLIICSPFRRTRETAETISANLADSPPVIVDSAIMPGAGVEEIMKAVKERAVCSDDEWILVVGHEPDISSCVRELLKASGDFKIPCDSGTLFGIELACREGNIHGKLVFTFSPMAMRS